MSMRAERKTPGKLLTYYSNKFSNSFTEYSGSSTTFLSPSQNHSPVSRSLAGTPPFGREDFGSGIDIRRVWLIRAGSGLGLLASLLELSLNFANDSQTKSKGNTRFEIR